MIAASMALAALAFVQHVYSDAEWTALRNGAAAAVKTAPAAQPNSSIRPPLPVKHYADTVHRFACALNLPPDLALAIAEQETNFVPAIGKNGEIGVMQVLPSTAEQYGLDRNRIAEPQYGIYAGLIILAEILAAKSDVKDAVAAYNAGIGFRRQLAAPETAAKVDRYVNQVLERRKTYRAFRCR